MQAILQDLLYTFRQLRKNPGFALLAIAVLALGIGANTAVFSVVNAVLLKPLAFHDPDRIVTLASLWEKSGHHGQVSAPDFHDWHDQSNVFAAMAYYETGEFAVAQRQRAEYTNVTGVTPEFFSVFQVSPMMGRLFSPEELKKGGGGAVVVSDSYWRSHFLGNAPLSGQTVKIFEHTLNVVGVLPPGMRFPDKTEIWLPANTIDDEINDRSAHNYLVVGRIRPGVSLGQAQAQMTSIGARLAKQYPDSNIGKSVAVTPMRDDMVSNIRLTLLLLLAAVAVVLLIACANMANLLLAKASGRVREMAIRAAVGASRGRIIRQLITESLLLAVGGGLAAIILSASAAHVLISLAPAGVPRIGESTIDGSVLIFTLAISLVASLLFGLAPALHLSRLDLYEALKPTGRAGEGARSGGLRSALVVAQIALSVVLLAGAGLLIKSFIALHTVDLGFQPENLLIMESDIPTLANYPPSPEEMKGLQHATSVYRDLLAEVAAMPGVRATGAARVPPGDVRSSGGYWIDNLPAQMEVTAPQAVFSVVTPGAFAALGIPVLRGRDFQDSDTFDAPFTAIINQALARASFAGQDPIGRTIFCGMDSMKGMRIVGVVGDIRQRGPAAAPEPEIFLPYQQHPLVSTAMNVMVRSTLPAGALEKTLEARMRALSPDTPVRFTTLETELSENIAVPRFRTLLIGVFAGLALLLAMVGVYAVMSYMVSQSTREIGVRMALGATRTNVLRLVLGQALSLSAAGLVLGLVGALVLSRLMKTVLFMVKPTDPVTLIGVSAVLLLVAVLASYVPARRATRVDPLIAMRYE